MKITNTKRNRLEAEEYYLYFTLNENGVPVARLLTDSEEKQTCVRTAKQMEDVPKLGRLSTLLLKLFFWSIK